MKRGLIVLTLSLLVAVSLPVWAAQKPMTMPPELENFIDNLPDDFLAISVEGLDHKIERKEKFVLIDVSEPHEFERGHIPGAVNIPLRQLCQEIEKHPDYKSPQEIAGKKPDLPAGKGDAPRLDAPRLDPREGERPQLQPREGEQPKMEQKEPEIAHRKIPPKGGAQLVKGELLLPRDTKAPIVVYCRNGSRSAMAMTVLSSVGYSDVRNLTYGFALWELSGLPTASK